MSDQKLRVLDGERAREKLMSAQKHLKVFELATVAALTFGRSSGYIAFESDDGNDRALRIRYVSRSKDVTFVAYNADFGHGNWREGELELDPDVLCLVRRL